MHALADYADAFALERSLPDVLRYPATLMKGEELEWVLGPKKLLPPGLADAWTPLSERNTLIALAAPCLA